MLELGGYVCYVLHERVGWMELICTIVDINISECIIAAYYKYITQIQEKLLTEVIRVYTRLTYPSTP